MTCQAELQIAVGNTNESVAGYWHACVVVRVPGFLHSGSLASFKKGKRFMSATEPTTHSFEIGSICRRSVISIEPGVDILAAARLMREKHVGYLVVTEPSAESSTRVVGVITDRDIVVAVVAREAEPRSLKAGDVMTRNPLIVAEDCSLDAALSFMRDAGVRRVPVVGSHGELKGVLSVDDVLERMAQQLTNIAGSFRSEQRTETVMRP